MEIVDLLQYQISMNVIKVVPENLARKYTLIPIEIDEGTIKIAMMNPANLFAIQDIKLVSKREVIPLKAKQEEIEALINRAYASSKAIHSIQKVENQMKIDYKARVEEIVTLQEEEESTAYLEWVESLIEEGIAMGASDIHIEPLKNQVKVRYRIDGRLEERQRLGKEILGALTTCIKIMANLDIAEKRLPQDGRITKEVGHEEVDLRVSILPTIFGEKTMIRLIYRMGMRLRLEDLGFRPKDFMNFKRLLQNPYGLILITGPTGSGKSTTLSTILRELNESHRNIITVEDPVETVIEGINQVVTNSKVGLDFAQVLRAILRQDPDILMIGEIRDRETAEIAIRAAMTGHLVLSTLHTNDALSAVTRLVDMGIEPYMVESALKGVVAQRLVRKICPQCKQSYEVTAAHEKLYGVKEGITAFRGAGCISCHGSGYKGRKAVQEIFILDDMLQERLTEGIQSMNRLREAAHAKGMQTLRENIYEDVLEGITTLEEMLRIGYEQ